MVTMKLSTVFAVTLACLLVIGAAGIADGQTWTPMTNAPPVSFGAMVLLTDGRVLIHEEPNCSGSTCKGKDYTAWYTLTPDINGSYVNGTWTQVASLPGGYAPLYFASAVLKDGKVGIQGGEYQCPAGSCTATWQSLGAFFDPVANTWTATTPPVPNALGAMGDSESVVLNDGTWMIGICCAQFVGYTPYPDYVYFNEGSLNFTGMGYTGDGQTTEYDEAGFNLLPYNPSAPSDSQVLMVNVPLGAYSATLATSQVYDEASNSWAAPVSTQVQLWDADCGNSASASYELGPVMLLPNGNLWGTGASSCAAGHTALYNPTTATWTAMPDFPNKGAVNDAAGATEINGNAIVATSPYTGETSTPVTFYEFNSSTNTINTIPNPVNAAKDDSFVGHLLVLPTGQILWTDFTTTGIEILTSAGTYSPSWQPTITTAPSSLTIGQTYPISGTQFNGVTTGASYGDDFQDNTNYPLVRIVNNSTSHVFYARTHDHSTMGVQTGSLAVSTNFDMPNMETGACQLYVVASGIPSAPSACNVALPVGIYSPANGTPLSGTTVTFTWGGDPNATAYWIDVGSTLGGNNLYSSGSLPTSTLSATVQSIPLDGSKVYVRWYENVNGTFQPTDYSYTAPGGASNKGSINTPVPSSTLTSAAPTFTWSAGVNATAYWLTAGSTVNGSDYYSSGNLGNVLTVAASKLPTNASTVYVTLYSLVAGGWLNNNYTYAAVNAANGAGPVMSTPTPSSTLTSGTVTFSWGRLTGATGYWLDAGSTAGAHDYYSSGAIASGTRSATVKTLPTNGSTIYITLYGLISGTYYANDYTYTAVNVATAGGVMSSPTSGSTLTGSSVTFTWTAGAAATAYWLDVGSTSGSHNYSSSGNLGNVLTTTVNGLPTDGSPVYATLYSLIGGVWAGNTYNYTALNASAGLATIQSPTPSTTLSGSAATFTWSTDPNATAYWLDIGPAPSGNTIYTSGNLGNVQSTSVYSLPANGSTIYVTLYSYVGGQWLSTSATYVSGP
jgi:hypothetical protein